ncbi:MAG: uracil phosphoribosyltransferase [Phycisphaerales bacterium]
MTPNTHAGEAGSNTGSCTGPNNGPNTGVVIFDHPLIAHKLATIRDQATAHRLFRAALAQIAGLMVYEVTRSLPTREVDVQTPVTATRCQVLDGTITIVPVLRAGLGMIDGILEVMPEARVGHLGLARDEQTLEPHAYLNKLPRDMDAGAVILVDPMLATGGSASAALTMLRQAGAKDIRMICLVAAPEGIARLKEDHPEVTIYAAALDDRLNEKGYIVPGLGDAGDRMYGTVE